MKLLFIVPVLAMWAANLMAQQTMHLAYVYPAGGQQGATFEVTAGGQYLANVSSAIFSDTNIQATFVEYNRPMNFKEFNDLRDELKKLREKWQASRRASSADTWTAADQARFNEIRAKILKNPPNRQANPAMVETVRLKVSVAANAPPGQYELRLRAPNGLSNPLNFYIGQLHEISRPPARAVDPEIARLFDRLGATATTNNSTADLHIMLPVTVNGQIMPGGADRYWFSATGGQELVICVQARALIPYLADAVPGWFEATATICDSKGHPLAYDDRFRFSPDPVIHFTVPHDGMYRLEIHDSIYRGREDFVYRASLGELPYVTDIFPLGGRAGEKTTVTLNGWNLPGQTLMIDNSSRPPGVYPVSVSKDGKISNPICFAVDTLPECNEQAPNGTPETAQSVTLPVIVNGRIDSPGADRMFRFEGRASERIVAETVARRLGSPLDSTLELTDSDGKRLAFNDDYDDECAGLETDHADSYLTATLPADGTYFICLRDAQQQGGPAYAYRLRLSEPRPDFALRVAPSSLNVRAGMSVPVTVFALRKDGFTNAIELRLKDAPAGFALTGARIPANQDKVQFTLKAPLMAGRGTFSVAIEGQAIMGEQTIIHPAVPAENMMQAFAYWHLVPVQELEVSVAPNPRPFATSMIKVLSQTPIKIPAGGMARVLIATPSSAFAQRFELSLDGAPAGLSIQSVSPAANGVEMALHCGPESPKPGVSGNLIVSITPKMPAAAKPSKSAALKPRGGAVATLPAIPFEIVTAPQTLN